MTDQPVAPVDQPVVPEAVPETVPPTEFEIALDNRRILLADLKTYAKELSEKFPKAIADEEAKAPSENLNMALQTNGMLNHYIERAKALLGILPV